MKEEKITYGLQRTAKLKSDKQQSPFCLIKIFELFISQCAIWGLQTSKERVEFIFEHENTLSRVSPKIFEPTDSN